MVDLKTGYGLNRTSVVLKEDPAQGPRKSLLGLNRTSVVLKGRRVATGVAGVTRLNRTSVVLKDIDRCWGQGERRWFESD